MGLAAIVCRKEEADAPDVQTARAHEFLGNVAEISYLHDAVGKRLGLSAVIVKAVLFSGSHSGDSLSVDQSGVLQQELARLQGSDDPSIDAFCHRMERLVNAALEEGTPIVFV